MEKSFKYTVKRNYRARRVTLRMSSTKGLVLTVPLRFSQKNIPWILNQHSQWIRDAFSQMQNAAEKRAVTLPYQILLTALNELWHVKYAHKDGGKIRMAKSHNNTLVIQGDTADYQALQRVLTHWVRKKARTLLTDCLSANSSATGLEYKQFQLRGQTSRWGSCNARQCITLNFKLIFLPMALVRHVVLHELAHTIHLNHSPHFWRLLASLDPDWKENRQTLRRLTKTNPVPEWIHV